MFSIQYNSNHQPILYIQDKPLHSTRDPYRDIRLVSQNDRVNYQNFFFIGSGLGYAITSLISQIDVKNIFLFFTYEQEQTLFLQYQKSLDLDISPNNLFLLSEIDKWKERLSSISISQTKIILNPIYSQLMTNTPFSENYMSFQMQLKHSLMNQITDSAFGFRWWRNFIRNYCKSTQVFLSPSKPSQTPLLLVGSGFSTYQNIEILQKTQKNYIILAIPPILDLLLSYNIKPDIIVMTDGGSANRFYTAITSLDKNVKMICYPHVYTSILEWFAGDIFMLNSGLEQESLLTPELEYFSSGGSVASTMFDIACNLSTEIYTIGFDFAYTEYHPHYPGSPLETNSIFSVNRFYTTETKYTMQNYQGILWKGQYTSPVLKAYQEYFSQQVHRALQKGYHIMPLLDQTLSSIDKNSFLENWKSDKLAIKIKKDRLEQLKKEIDIAINNKQYNSILTLLLARAKLKGDDVTLVLEKEKKWLDSFLLKTTVM